MAIRAAAKAARDPGRECLAGGGEMGALMRSIDWSQTPIGAVENWSQSLRMMVSFLLANRFPLLLWWGPDYVSIYNDAYRPILGTKHPRSMGQPVRECWSEIWHILKPLIDTPFAGGPATWMEDIPLEINRHGFVEETHFTIAYSPVPDEDAPRGIGGVLATVHEITEKVLAERRVVALRDLGARAGEAKTAEEACAIAATTLAGHAADVPFALLYLVEAGGKRARLAGAAGIAAGEALSPRVVALDAAAPEEAWPLAEATRREETVVVEDFVGGGVPRGPWSDPPRAAVVVPVRSNTAHQLAGLLVAGVSPRLRLDSLYHSFFELMASQIATSIANARAYEEERKRAEALAEIDRAKTAFFSNVSHEFRTPLTLMLGPLEDALAAPAEALPHRRDDLALIHRNGLRLLRLVNTLLDFSRIEAGRVQACYEPVDLACFTAELASVFRAATDKAGLSLTVDCPPLSEPIWVDRDMWEKIVLNLVSNAFKFTLEGGIAVRLRQEGASTVLAVEDTGTGIPAHELPRLFDRFHRVEGARGRTHEGTGIGLALVQELAKLHGGTARAESTLGAGSTFTVTIPLGTAHLPADRLRAGRTLASTALGAQPFVEEALRWLPGAENGKAEPGIERSLLAEQAPSPSAGAAQRPTILIADDNADMRDYLRRLLSAGYDVRVVADGEEALSALRERRADLLLSDIMMPRMDGYALLREVRADAALADLPVVFLSARAGEEASVEGLAAGADDYLIKPFSARELLARVAANLETARIRRDAGQALRQAYLETTHILESIGDAFYALDRDLRFRYVNQRAAALWNRRPEDMLGRQFLAVFPQAAQSEPWSQHLSVLQTGAPARFDTISATIGRWVEVNIYPTADGGLSVFFQDISERKRAEQKEIAQRQILELVATGTPLNNILDSLMLFIQSQEPGMIAGLLLTDDGFRFRPGSGPSMPAAYEQALHEAIKTIPVTPPYLTPCAEATHCRRIIRCPEVATETRYAEAWREAMLASGLRAVRSTPVHASDGRVLGCLALYFADARVPDPADPELVGMATNLAAIAIERDGAERALRKTRAQLQGIFDEAPLCVYLVDSDFRVRAVNPAARPLFANISELIGRDFDEVIHILWPKAYADEIAQLFRHTLDTGEPYIAPERIERRLDLDVIEYHEWRISRVPLSEGRHGVVCYFRDISVQVLARQAIAASEERLAAELAATRRLQETSSVLIREGDSDALYRQILDAAIDLMRSDMASLQMLDQERGELRLLAWRGFDAASAASWEWVSADSRSSCGAALSSGRRVVVPDVELCEFMAGSADLDGYRQSGIRAAQSTPLVSRSGRLLGMISTHWREPHEPAERELRFIDVLARQAADLMERAAAESALRDFNASLEGRVKERTQELEREMAERQRVELALHQSQRLEAIGQLTGGVAHDFNNLLTVVIGQTEAIAMAADGDQRITRMATAAQRAAERGAQLTNQLLSFSGRQQLRPVTTAVAGLIGNVGDLVRRAIGEAITVEISVDPELWPSHVDPAQFESAILNLAINARDAMPQGGRLLIEARNATVAGGEAQRLDLASGDYVVTRVSDTGIGMSAEVRRRAFEPFYTTKDIGKGTGLGLSQIYGFVRQSHGTAIIESALGEGTTVALYLPRADAAAVQEKASSRRRARRLATGKTILVVEDQADVRDMIEVSLDELGYRVLTAADGVAARNVLQSNETIDLLLTDVVMPNGVSGLDLAEEARRLRQDLKIVLVSGYRRDNQSRVPRASGMTFLEKPFLRAELADTIASAFGDDGRGHAD